MRSLLIGLMVMCGGLGGAVASAEARTLYAYAAGTSTAATCPKASTTSAQCSLGTALTDAAAGDTVMLATPGASANYVGNWSVGTTGTSSSKPVTIDGGDVSGATLSGNNGNAAGCSTAACNGPVLHVSNNMFLVIENLTIEDGNNSATTDGGAIENIAGGNVTITDATFSENAAGVSGDGGAIGNGDGSGASGTVTITGSTFTENLAYEGAAVANGVETGGGTATITDSTFTGNEGRDGGAIANGIEDGAGTATIADSTFTNNLAADGGAIDTGDEDGNAAATIENSTFTGNGGGGDGGAIDNTDNGGTGTAFIIDSTFSDRAATDGGEIDTSDNTGNGNLVISASTLASGGVNVVTAGANSGTGEVFLAGTVFAGGCQQGGSKGWDDGGYNVGVDATCFNGGAGDVNAGSASALDLGPLADNGGLTETIALEPGSPAIGIIPNSTNPTLFTLPDYLCPGPGQPHGIDQRGAPRPGAGKSACDAGAFETQIDPTATAVSCAPASTATGTGTTCTATVSDTASFEPSTPTGAVSFAAVGPGGSFSPGSCTLSGDSCEVTFTPSAGGSDTIGASYAGDGSHQPSSGNFTVTATTSTPPPAPQSPANTAAPAITGTAKAGAVLSCSPGTWSGAAPLTYSYQWSRDGTSIVGATGSTYTVVKLDEGTTLTCAVGASNSGGHGTPATSAGFAIPVPFVPRCPAATGSLSGSSIGLIRLGMKRRQAMHEYRHSSNRGFAYKEFFCLTPYGVRIGLGSPKLLRTLPARDRRRYAGRVVWASTDNARYAANGIRAGATLTTAEKALPHGYLFRVGLNYWYLAPIRGATAVLKVRHDLVEEVGIAVKQLTGSHKADRKLMTSFE